MKGGPDRAAKRALRLGFLASDFWIKQMEVNDLNFELAFPERLRQDGSGEKGFEELSQNPIFHVEREGPQSFPRK